jgi:ABC-type cobalt transport system substrate-binding protein
MRERRAADRATKAWAKQLLKGHRGAALALLAGGIVLAAAAGTLPLLMDYFSQRMVLALQNPAPVAEWGLKWGKAGMAALLLLVAALICAPLRMGREAWYFGGADGKKRSPARVKFWLQPRWAFKAARFVLALGWRKLLWAVLYLLPGGFLLAGTLWQARSGNMDLLLFLSAVLGGGMILALGVGFYFATVQRYALVLPVLAKQPRCKLRNALRLSAARTEGSCAALLRFQLGFLPWALLSLLVVPLIYTAPYIAQSRACRCAELLNGGVTEE